MRRFVREQAGEIYVINTDGERLETPFLDLRDRTVTLEQGSMSGACLVWHSIRTSRLVICCDAPPTKTPM